MHEQINPDQIPQNVSTLFVSHPIASGTLQGLDLFKLKEKHGKELRFPNLQDKYGRFAGPRLIFCYLTLFVVFLADPGPSVHRQ